MNIASPERDKAKVRAAVESRGLVSLMSDTKWRELVTAVRQRLPFAPPFQVKDILASQPFPATFEEDVWHAGDWYEGTYPYYSVEWIRVRPRILRGRGHLLPIEKDDIEHEFLALLHEIGVPHRKCGDCIEIVGYATSTAGLER